jgi:hypothetical protein
MDVPQFARFLALYRNDLTRHQTDVLMASASSLIPSDWEGFVGLVLIVQTLADPNARRRELLERTSALRTRQCADLLVSL